MLDLIEQIELENQNLAYTSPYVRLVYSIATSAMKVHSINTMMAKRMDILNEPDQFEPDEHKETQEPEPKETTEPKKPEPKKPEPKKPQVISFD
jgi:outer membrane biosynthesis protein TonB